MALRVFMMGGLRCGKTSAIAGLYEQMRTSPISNYLTVADYTPVGSTLPHLPLYEKIYELRTVIEKNKESNRLFLVDSSPSCCFNNYKLRFLNPGTQHSLDIDFHDSVGNFFNVAYSGHSDGVIEYIKTSDVFIIAVDTPYLMGSTEEYTKELCTEAVNQSVNSVHELQYLLTHVDDNEGREAKMVVFVPVKCEKWAKEPGGLDRVTARVKEVYAPHISNLLSLRKVSVAIIPIQTSGNILFSEFRNSYIYYSKKESMLCCKIDDEIIRGVDGELSILKEGETVLEDDGAVLFGTNIHKPFSWFQVNPSDNSYSPVNCDQLGLHILLFILHAFIEEERNRPNFPWSSILPPANRYRKWLGTMDIQELKVIMERLQRDGVIKNNNDGIEIIKKL